jgi:hypothetical protein
MRSQHLAGLGSRHSNTIELIEQFNGGLVFHASIVSQGRFSPAVFLSLFTD